jgi:adenylate kinase family enzyme
MIEKDLRSFIFYGISGSGKGTQAKLLIEKLKEIEPKREVIYLETGARIREFIEDNAGFTRDMVKKILNDGGLLPEFIPISLWSHLLITRFTGKEHLVLDGAARRPHESPVVENALKFYRFKDPTIILLKVGRKWARERLLGRGRYDDDESEIDRRFDWFEKNTMPAVEYFRDKTDFKFVEIDGERSIEEVHEEILKAVGLK